MSEYDALEQSLTQTVAESELSSVGKDLAEIGIDALMHDGLVKDIPVVSTIIALVKTGASIRDYSLARKIIKFISALSDVSIVEIANMIARLKEEEGYSENVGEQILLLLDRLDNLNKARLLGMAFAAFARSEISDEEFHQLVFVIDRVVIGHLRYLPELIKDAESLPQNVLLEFIGAGLAWSPPKFATTTIRSTGAAKLLQSLILAERKDET